jgi:transaldolase/glucose-6-phosphate isomerase
LAAAVKHSLAEWHAQARGDFQVLLEHERRALRVHLGADVAAGLGTFHAALAAALAW